MDRREASWSARPKSRDEDIVYCSFCNKSQRDVVKVIAGPDVHICNECVELCNEIMEEERVKATRTSQQVGLVERGRWTSTEPPKPSVIFDKLSKVVVGQEEAKRDVAVAVFRHYLRERLGGDAFDKNNVLLIGPTGSGKTLLAKSLAAILDRPLAIVDATTYTEAGYVGDDVENMFRELMRVADDDREVAQRGVIYIDEIDKIGRRSANPSITRDVSGEGVQQTLLNILGGKRVSYDPSSARKNPNGPRHDIDTDNVLFICGGSFEGLDKIIAHRLRRSRNAASLDQNLLQHVTQDDLIVYGFMPEFASRFTTMTALDTLSREELVKVLRTTPQSPLRQYERILDHQDCSLTFTDGAIKTLAEIAMDEHAGARGLSRVVDRAMRDVLFALPDHVEIRSCTVDETVIRGQRLPALVDKDGHPVAARRDRVFISYSRKDAEWLTELTTTLNPLMRKNTLKVWFDKEIKPSQVWRKEIAEAVAATSVAVLLLSPSFLASDFINAEELPYFLRAAQKEQVKIIWVLLSECLYEETPIADLQAAHDVTKPLVSLPMAQRHSVWVDISRSIKAAAEEHERRS